MEFGWYHEFHRQGGGESDADAFTQALEQVSDGGGGGLEAGGVGGSRGGSMRRGGCLGLISGRIRRYGLPGRARIRSRCWGRWVIRCSSPCVAVRWRNWGRI